MEKQSSSTNWTKGSNNDSKSTPKNDFNNKTNNNCNSFEFLDMSSCDETQKLKLKNTLSSPSSFSTQRDRYRSNFSTRNSSVRPIQQQYSSIQYHANSNSKNQKSNYQFYQTKHPISNEHDPMGTRHVPISIRTFSSDASTFSSQNNSNFNNNISTLNNTTKISSKRLDDNRHYPNTQDKLIKWHSNNKKPPYVGLKDSTQINQKDTSSKRTGGLKESHHYHQSKDSSRDSNKNFQSNRIMSPPITNSTTSTTISMPNQSNVSVQHYSSQQMQYGSSHMHPQMYPSGSVPLISSYPMHAGYMTAPSPGQPMISPYTQHNERSEMSREIQNDHTSNSSHHPMNSTRGSGGGPRRGRSRGGGSNMSRRDYQMRQNNQNQQQADPSNEYGQSLMDQGQPGGAVMTSGPFTQYFIHPYPAYYSGPNGGPPHLAALPTSASTATAQSLTGQPLFIQQPVLYHYGGNYPFMYNMVPTGPPMPHQQSDMVENEHNPSQESGGAAPAAVLQPMPWAPHVAYQEPQPIFQHSPHPGEVDLEFQVNPEEYHLQMINHPNNYLMASDQHGMVNEIVQTDQDIQQEVFVEAVPIEGETLDEQRLYQQDVETSSDTRLLIEKTRDLMIQTTPQEIHPPPHHQLLQPQETCSEKIDVTNENNQIVPNTQEIAMLSSGSVEAGSETAETNPIHTKFVDNKMIVRNKDKPPAWSNIAANPPAPVSVKKQTASVSVSAIPNKDLLQNNRDSASSIKDPASDVPTAFPNPDDFKPLPQKDHQNIPTSFSSIITAKQPLSSPTMTYDKKTEKQTEIQPLQKQQQLSERAKQQLVTTITGVGANSQEFASKSEAPANAPLSTTSRNNHVSSEELKTEKAPQPSKPSLLPSNSTPSGSWAGLFNSSESMTAPKIATSSTASPSIMQNQTPETQASTAKNIEPQSFQGSPQVPGVMSYSAVSAQVVSAPPASTIPPQTAATSGSLSKKLPQSKQNLAINNNENHSKSPPVDQYAVKLGDFFSKYKIESHSVSLLPRGLLNKSNYCYINATLQALVACPPFYHLMKSIPQMPSTYRNHTKTPVTDAMIELVSNYSQLPYRKRTPRELSKKDDVPEITRDTAFEPIVILKMLQALRTDMFPVEGRQEDAEEFLSFILNRMNDEMIELKKLVEKPKIIPKKEENGDDINGNADINADDDEEWQVISGTRNKSTITRTTDFGRSPISDIFGGKLRLRVHREGDHPSDNIEPFFTLKLVIEKASSVREALEILVGRDQLEGVTCSRTNQEVAAWQQVQLEELPVVLILHLKCFDFKKESCTKILKTVEFPVELKIDSKIMASKIKYQAKQKQYKLFAVVYHDGKEASKGHYITDVFHVGYSNWIRYDDSSVKPVTEHNVLHPKSPRVPYLLYYRRYDTIAGNRDHNSNNHQTNQKSTK